MFEVLIFLFLVFCAGLFLVPLLGANERRMQRRLDRSAAAARHPSTPNVTPIGSKRGSS